MASSRCSHSWPGFPLDGRGTQVRECACGSFLLPSSDALESLRGPLPSHSQGSKPSLLSVFTPSSPTNLLASFFIYSLPLCTLVRKSSPHCTYFLPCPQKFHSPLLFSLLHSSFNPIQVLQKKTSKTRVYQSLCQKKRFQAILKGLVVFLRLVTFESQRCQSVSSKGGRNKIKKLLFSFMNQVDVEGLI